MTASLVERRFLGSVFGGGVGTALNQLLDHLDTAGDAGHVQRSLGELIPVQSFTSGGTGDRKKKFKEKKLIKNKKCSVTVPE